MKDRSNTLGSWLKRQDNPWFHEVLDKERRSLQLIDLEAYDYVCGGNPKTSNGLNVAQISEFGLRIVGMIISQDSFEAAARPVFGRLARDGIGPYNHRLELS
jgi:hypothetical protein